MQSVISFTLQMRSAHSVIFLPGPNDHLDRQSSPPCKNSCRLLRKPSKQGTMEASISCPAMCEARMVNGWRSSIIWSRWLRKKSSVMAVFSENPQKCARLNIVLGTLTIGFDPSTPLLMPVVGIIQGRLFTIRRPDASFGLFIIFSLSQRFPNLHSHCQSNHLPTLPGGGYLNPECNCIYDLTSCAVRP